MANIYAEFGLYFESGYIDADYVGEQPLPGGVFTVTATGIKNAVSAEISDYVQDSNDYIATGYFTQGISSSATVTAEGETGPVVDITTTATVTAAALDYRLEDGTDYTWDNTVPANGYDWDCWPDNVWGEFMGTHIPAQARTTVVAVDSYVQL